MKRYEAYVGIFTKANGNYVKVNDVEAAINRLVTTRISSNVDQPGAINIYSQALEDLRKELQNG